MAYRKSSDYTSMLSDFLYGYNARPHTAFLPFAPREVNKNNEAQVHELQYGEYLRQQKAKHIYSFGDHMRKAIKKVLSVSPTSLKILVKSCMKL